MTRNVNCRQLTLMPHFWPARPDDLQGTDDDWELTSLYYALGPLESTGYDDQWLEADPSDIQRWQAASARLARTLARIDRRPGAAWKAARWKACRRFAEASGDLTDVIRERQRQSVERQQSKEHGLRRLAMVASEHGAPVWRYHRHFCENPSLGQSLSIMDLAIDALDPCPDQQVAGETELTLDEVSQACLRLRGDDPYLSFSCSVQTAHALREQADTASVREAWQQLTGVDITDPPPRPLPPRTRGQSYSPPITDYGIPTTF